MTVRSIAYETPPERSIGNHRLPDFPTIVVFFLPILTIYTIHVGGDLMLSDIAVALLLPFLLFSSRWQLRQPFLFPILLMLTLWFGGAIISDIINGSSLQNLLRGWAGIIFFGFHLVAFFVLVDGRRDRYIAAIVGVAVATPLQWLTGNSAFSSEDLTDTPWKMGNGFAVTLLFTSVAASRLRSNRAVGQLLVLLAPVHLFLNARSLFLTTALAGITSSLAVKTRSTKQRTIILVAVVVAVVVALPLAEAAYGQLVASGAFGKDAQQKYEIQTDGGNTNILLGGRSESLISLQAIADAPFFGHGSWAESRQYYYQYLQRLDDIGRGINWQTVNDQTDFLIPSHSMLLGSWVYHGVAAGAFWIFILTLTLRAIARAIAWERAIPTLETLVLFALLWDIFFSPFGETRRCIEAVYVVTACTVLRSKSHSIR